MRLRGRRTRTWASRADRATRRDWRRDRRISIFAAVTGATAACFHTLKNRCTAVIVVSTSISHRIGTRLRENNSPRQSRMIRSARSIRPPLAFKPSDSALARWYEISDDTAITAKGNTPR